MKITSGTILIAFFAILAGMIGAYAYRQLNRSQPVVEAPAPPEPPRPPKPMIVPMVSRNLTSGQIITMDDVALVRMTRQQMEEAGLGKKPFMTKPEQIIGKRAKNALRRGSTFDTRDFYPPGQGPGIAHRLKPGLRAVTVSMTPINALLGFAGAGQSVDVLFHYGDSGEQAYGATVTGYMPPGRRSQLGIGNNVHGATSTLVQGAEILALNQSANPTPGSSGVSAEERTLVTLAVYPREAELLRVAGGHGELSLSLRNPTDDKAVPLVDPRTVDEIINVRSNIREMEIYRGKQVSKLQFASVGGVNRRLIDGSRDNKLADVIEKAKQQAEKAKHPSEQQTINAGHQPLDKRKIELAPVLEPGSANSPVGVVKPRWTEPDQHGIELSVPSTRGR